MFELIRNYFLSIKRSPLFEDIFIANIFTFLVFSFSYVTLFVFGFLLDKIFEAIESGMAPIDMFSCFFLFLFVVDIILKYLFKLHKPVDVLSYLTLPIPRKKIYTLLFFKELVSAWNFIWVVLLTPFFFKTVYPTHGLASTLLLIFSVYLASLTISSVIRIINIISIWKSFWYTFFSLFLALCVGYTAYYVAIAPRLLVNIDLIFSQYKIEVLIGSIFLVVSIFVVFLKSCRREIYSVLAGKKNFTIAFNFRWLNSIGLKGEIINLCFREIVRSQLKLTVLYAILSFVACLFLLNNGWGNFMSQCCIALLPTLLLGRIYGENTYNLESTFFDKLMVSPATPPYLILKTKYALCVIHAAINTIISIIVCINKVSILFWLSTFFFGCGILLFFIFQNVVYNKQRVNILESQRNFYELTIHSIILVLLMILPTGFIIVTVEGLTSETIAEYLMLITGMAGMAGSPLWLKNIYNRFLSRKYQTMSNFRNS